MKHTWRARIGTLAIAACLAFSSMPAFADGTKQIKVTLTDVTATDAATQYGEAKIKVSILGADGNVSAVQNAFTFEGLDYKNVQFLKGENNPPECVWVSPDKAKANADKKFSVGIAAPSGIAFGDNEEVYIITFSGEPGEKVTLNVADGTFCVTDGGSKITASADGMCEAAASAKENKSIDAVIKLTMDKITGFNAAAETGITLKITSQTTKGYLITDILSNKAVQEGGHRESTDIPTFTVKNSVLAGDKYTVELYGAGYVTYKKTDVTFDKPLEITNADFVPGDVNDDGKVDADDKALAEKSKNGDYSEAADFDRNGKTDSADMKVFDGISDKTVPTKMTKPTVTGGSKKITVKWTKPTDESITGYTIKYGTSKDTLTGTKEIDKADTVSADITELSANTAYYLQIAAKNAAGTGEFSDIVNAKTDAENTQGGGGTGGGGGGGGGSTGGGSIGGGGGGSTGGSGYTPSTPNNPTTPSSGETFTDLENHAWAKDAVYTLKNKGIISGISDTEFAPANNIKRGDFILILTRMLVVNNEFTENFADVPESAYYYQAIGSAKAAGIAQGSGENFMPENSITRQDLITLAYRAFLAKGYITETTDLTSLDTFGDKDSISDYAKTSMASMVKAGIIQGSNGNVNPKGFATRAEVAVMCARLVELMK
ncbi:MAG: S-layer homology domain-containing protein [Eubacteriales bacterium]|nr:S-layer homology domain-containing protein [Eubacteriales bacterium]